MPRCFLLKRPNEVLKRTHNSIEEETKNTENTVVEERIASEKDEVFTCQDSMELSPIKKKKVNEEMRETPLKKHYNLDIQSNVGNDSGFYEEYSLWKSPTLCSPLVKVPYRAVSPHLARTSYTVTNVRTPKRCSSVPIEYTTPSKTQHTSIQDSPRTSNNIIFENVTPKKPTFATPVKPIHRTHALDASSPMSTFHPRMSTMVVSRPRLSPIPKPSSSIFPVQTVARLTNSPRWESPLRRPVLTRNQGFVRCFTPGLSPISTTNQTPRVPSARPTYIPFSTGGGQLLPPFDPRLPFPMRPGIMTSSPRRIPLSVASSPRFGNSVATNLPPTHYSPVPHPVMRTKAENDTYVPLDLTRSHPPTERQPPEVANSGYYLVQPVHAFLQREVISGPLPQTRDFCGQEIQRDTTQLPNNFSQPASSQPTMIPRTTSADRPFSTPPSPQFSRFQAKVDRDVAVQRPLSFSPAPGPPETEVRKSMKSQAEESKPAVEGPKATIQSPVTSTDKPTISQQGPSTEPTTMKHWKKSIVGQNPVESTVVPVPLKLPEPKVEPPNPTLVRETSSPPLLNLLQAAGKLDIELINGGYGIKNPSFSELHLKELENIAANNGKENTKFKCPICLKEFALLRLLNRHVKNHSDIKRYLCTFCGKGFNDTFDLKRHTRIHTGVKPYKCENCGKSFTQRCSLESHGKKVHGSDFRFEYKQRRNKMYVCEDCGHTTPDPEVHFIHLKENHPGCPALVKCHDKRQFKFNDSSSINVLRPLN